MNSDVLFSFARQALTMLGTYLVTRGYIDAGSVQTIIGAVIALGSVGWSPSHHATPALPKP